MAILKLTIFKESDRENNENKKIEDLKNDIVLNTTTQIAIYKFNSLDYLLNLIQLDLTMQMYRPSEIFACISIIRNEGKAWENIPRECLEVFMSKRVAISSDSNELGTDFYVHEVIPEYYTDCIYLKLKIYSPDKVLTLRNTSRTFVGKRLSDILNSELSKYTHPSDKKNSLKYNTDNLQVLKFSTDKGDCEHMFPFLVQYNESVYDLLARTANRWGEFMYYRDGMLHFGYNAKQVPIDILKKENKTDTKEKYYRITYPSYNNDDILTKGDTNGVYDLQAALDENVSHTPVQKSPYLVAGELGKFNGAGNKYLMRKIASFLGNDKDLTTWLTNNLVDDLVSLAQSSVFKSKLNDALDEKYFEEMRQNSLDQQYGKQDFTLYEEETENKEAFNEFSEQNSPYTAARYKAILAAELEASKNMVQIDFDTNTPEVNLGDRIIVNDEVFIVVGITAKSNMADGQYILENGEISSLVKSFVVTAVGIKHKKKVEDNNKDNNKDNKANNTDNTNKTNTYSTDIIYPTMLPSGHVKYSGPQKGVIYEEDDPNLQHRVRVLFDWQYYTKKEDGKNVPKPIDGATASPWLIFAAKGEGKASTGRHVFGTKVLVGFIDGNIERPYVIGAIQDKIAYDKTIDVDLDTDQGHFLRLTDGSRTGG